ncbi:MAG: DMP19 family protein [Limisphaerales bacterium]
MKNIFIVLVMVVVVAFAFIFPKFKDAQRAKRMNDWYEKQYGAFGKTAEAILSHDNGTNGFLLLGALHYRIEQKAKARGEDSLTDTERRLLAAFWVEAEVNNGGFDQYFFNSAGNNAETALAGLKEMDAVGAAALLERAMTVFPSGKPPADRFKRQEVMQQIAEMSEPLWDQCDKEFYNLKENVSQLAFAYAKKKKVEIVLP